MNAIRDKWLALPEWLRKGLRDAAIGAIAAASILNLGIPGSLVEAKAEALTAFAVVIPAIAAIIRVELLPNAVSWFLGKS